MIDDMQMSGRRSSRRSRARSRDALPVYPLPDYGVADLAMSSPETMTTLFPPIQPSTAIGSPMPVFESPTAAAPSIDAPSSVSGPTLIPQADPAHTRAAPENTAGLPVVEPY